MIPLILSNERNLSGLLAVICALAPMAWAFWH